ncbi:hypothetical protein GL279_01625 [Paracoccus limosus]|uniref:Alpha/beta hydrolase n=1 Tax=Paracoccus limosus TaxID=913252 RepID=A0A844GXX4_9RHOB|nr:hypothetical protein [Paracoccus limosus]MTH33292.1 hypothetical protein [Paracoccus limosus]
MFQSPMPAAPSRPEPPQVLFDGEHLQLLYQPGPGPLTVLSFDIMHARANGRNAFARKLCLRNGLPLLGVVPKYPCWYPATEIVRIAEICRRLGRGPVIAYGASMGGYGALRWGKFLGAHHVLACSPQATIDPGQTGPGDRRYGRYFQPAQHAVMAVRAEHVAGQAAVLYDPRFGPDRVQAGLLADLDGVSLLPLPFVAHGTAACLSGSANALAAFQHLIAGDFAALRRQLLARRKLGGRYHLELATAAIRHGRHALAQRLAAPVLATDPLGYHMVMARRAMAVGEPAAAAGHYRSALAAKPGHRIAEMHLAKLVAEAGEVA